MATQVVAVKGDMQALAHIGCFYANVWNVP
jgi:hypothetical protein